MRTLMSGDVPVSYGQIYVAGVGGFDAGMSECFGGQDNGLCGAVEQGSLFLRTGLHTGDVGFAVELHERQPPVGEVWEEVVEASFHPEGDVLLQAWGGDGFWPLELDDTDYRVRYCARNMDQAADGNTMVAEDQVIDRYLLQFWPAPPQRDRVVRQTSDTAARGHHWAKDLPPPPTAEEKAERARLEGLERERAIAVLRLNGELREWGGVLPDERLRRIRGNALSLAEFDRPLLDALAAAEPPAQREIARWAARRGFAEAGLVEVDWIAPALAAADRGDPLPSPFDDQRRAWDLLLSDEQVPKTVVTSPDGTIDNYLQQAAAFSAIFSVQHEDPLHAAVDALWAAVFAFGHGRHQVLFAEVRRAFPLD